MIIFQPDRHLLRHFIAEHAHSFSGRVLDAGGGNRRYAHFFKHCTYQSLDKNAQCKPDIVGSIENIPLANSSVDGILCSQVLGDIWDIPKALSELTRVLRPGGVLLITESLFNEEHDEPHDYWRLTRFAWQRLLANAYTIEVLEGRGGFFTQRAQQTIRYWIERYRLYQRPLLGRFAHIWACVFGKWALLRDRWDTSPANRKFPIGYCILARKQ